MIVGKKISLFLIMNALIHVLIIQKMIKLMNQKKEYVNVNFLIIMTQQLKNIHV